MAIAPTIAPPAVIVIQTGQPSARNPRFASESA
jgi:hypothetical protein